MSLVFQKAGEGHTLTESTRRPQSSQQAGPSRNSPAQGHSAQGHSAQGHGAPSNSQRSVSEEKQRAAEAALIRSQGGVKKSKELIEGCFIKG